MRIFFGERPEHITGLGEECVEAWKDTWPFVMNTERLTPVRLRIDDDDVTGLFYALIDRYRKDERHMEIMKICAEALTRLAPACQQAVAAIAGSRPSESTTAS